MFGMNSVNTAWTICITVLALCWLAGNISRHIRDARIAKATGRIPWDVPPRPAIEFDTEEEKRNA